MLRSSLSTQNSYWQVLDRYLLEDNYRKIQSKICSKYNDDFIDLVKDYRNISGRQIYPMTEHYLEENPEVPMSNIRLIKNAIELGRTSFTVSDSVSPIIFHYSWHCLFNFLNYSMFYWDKKHAEGHGLRPKFGDAPHNIILEVQKAGVFQRWIDLTTLLGFPTPFSRKIPKILDNQLRFVDNPARIFEDNGIVNIQRLLDFDVYEWKEKLGFDNTNFPRERIFNVTNSFPYINQILVNYSIAFTASGIARYRPLIWNRILRGENAFCSQFMERYQMSIRSFSNADYGQGFIMCIEDIFRRIDHFGLRNHNNKKNFY